MHACAEVLVVYLLACFYATSAPMPRLIAKWFGVNLPCSVLLLVFCLCVILDDGSARCSSR
jgi:hypothetical protein